MKTTKTALSALVISILILLAGSITTGAQVQVYAAGTVNTTQLNLRPIPALFGNSPFAGLPRGTLVYITAQSPDGLWYQVIVNDALSGWVYNRYITVIDGNIFNIPVTTNPALPIPPPNTGVQQPTPDPPMMQPPMAPTSAIWTVGGETAFVNVRTGPGLNYAVIGRLSRGQLVTVTGRSVDNAWVRVTVSDAAGNPVAAWVYFGAFIFEDIDSLPYVQ